MLGDMKFLDSLKTYDKDNIPAATIKKIRDKYVPMASFNAKEVAKVSSGAFSLLISLVIKQFSSRSFHLRNIILVGK